MESNIKQLITNAIQKSQADFTDEVQLSIPQLQFGDYSSNVALILAKKLKRNTMEIAIQIADSVQSNENIEKCVAIKPGFVNVWIKKNCIFEALNRPLEEKLGSSDSLAGVKIMVEYTDPNFFKEFHVGHLYSNIVGESLTRIFEVNGALVKRANYQGDVGMHVSKYLWGAQEKMKKEELTIQIISTLNTSDRAKFMGQSYALGTQTYESNEQAKKEMKEINRKVYTNDPTIHDLYENSRTWTLEYYETIYERLGTHFDYYYFEREAGKVGLEFVKENLKKDIFKESEGAIVFKGEEYGLHTRVFVNSAGFPTYEAKDLGLAPTKYKDFPYDKSLIVVGSEIKEYFTVVMKALELINPELRKKTSHVFHGMVNVPEGKMSSRLGNVITANWLLDETQKKALQKMQEVTKTNVLKARVDTQKQNSTAEIVGMAAIKYALLKNGIGGNITFNFDESVSFEGNSGPYLQYTYVRCQSVLERNNLNDMVFNYSEDLIMNNEEQALMRFMYQFPENVKRAAVAQNPSIIATYLFNLAQQFNVFYQNNSILKSGGEQKQLRLFLTVITARIIKEGLYLLGIKTVQKM